MGINVVEESPEILGDYEKVPIAFLAETYFRVELSDGGLGGFKLREAKIEKPFVKDYDAGPAERPSNWAKRFDLSNWCILSAFDGRRRIGGAALAWKSPEVMLLAGRDDLACLWDLRVAPDRRKEGVGRALFAAALARAVERGCRLLKVETQNINVPACRFYARQGCQLGAIDRFAYPEWPGEVQMVWYRELGAGGSQSNV